MVEEWEHYYAQVNEMKEKSIDSTFEKKTQEKGWGRVIYQSQTGSGSQAWKMLKRNVSSSLACLSQAITQNTFTHNNKLLEMGSEL